MIEDTLRDLRIAFRELLRQPGFTAVAVITLGLGIGATTAVFSVVYSVLFRPLPFPNAERMVQIVQFLPPPPAAPAGNAVRAGLQHSQFAVLEDGSTTLAAVGRYLPASATLTGRGDPARLTGAAIAPAFFARLGVSPLLGRTLQDGDGLPGADPVVVLGYRTWRTYFGGDPSVIDSRIELGETSPRVVGVMPAGFGFPSIASSTMTRNSAGELDDAPEYWVPTAPVQRRGPSNTGSFFPAFALLRADVTLAQAEQEIRRLITPPLRRPGSWLTLVNAREEMGREVSRALLIFQGGVALVLLIACVNVVNLLLARSSYRRSELAVRTALGASRTRLVSEGVSEALLLSAAGGVAGCAIGFGLIAAVRALPPNVLPRFQDIRVDTVTLGFAVGVSVASGIAVGLFSALRVARGAPWSTTPRPSAAVTMRTRPSSVLVVVEIAAAMVLVMGAGLLTGSFARLMSHETGYEPDGVMTFRVSLPQPRYATASSQVDVYNAVATALRKTPAVESVGATGGSVTGYGLAFWSMQVDGNAAQAAEFDFRAVTPGYFETLRVPVRRGRTFTAGDIGGGTAAVVVSESFARNYLGGEPIGRRLVFPENPKDPEFEVVGVVGDVAHTPGGGDRAAAVYFPPGASSSTAMQNLVVLARTSAGLSSILPAARTALRAVDPQLAVYDAASVGEILAQSSSSPRFYALVSIVCGTIAFALAAIGLYGLLAYSVGMRTREFGIRMALGADRVAILLGVLWQGVGLTAAGVAVGALVASVAAKSMESLLFGVTPHDGTTFALAAGLLLAASLAASYMPSTRATRVDPVVALRSE